VFLLVDARRVGIYGVVGAQRAPGFGLQSAGGFVGWPALSAAASCATWDAEGDAARPRVPHSAAAIDTAVFLG
jgi:hypothetical protein